MEWHLHVSSDLHHLAIEARPPKIKCPLMWYYEELKKKGEGWSLFGMCFFSAVYCWSSAWSCTDLLVASMDAGKDSLNVKLGMEFRCVCATNQVSVFHVSHGRRCKEDLKTLPGGELLSAQITWKLGIFFPLSRLGVSWTHCCLSPETNSFEKKVWWKHLTAIGTGQFPWLRNSKWNLTL